MTACGELVSELLTRVRDPQGTATPRAVVRDLLQRAQILFVRSTGTLIREYTLSITPERLVYDYDAQTGLGVLDLFLANKRLWPVRWPQMYAQRGASWWRGVSDAGPRVWAPLGTTHLLIYPAVSEDTGALNVTVRDQQRPADLGDDTVEMELPDQYFPRLLDFVEVSLYVRQRDPALDDAMQRLGTESEPEHEEVA